MTNCIDISKWQSTYNAETAKAAGVNEVILRCAYGTSKDICFDEFYATAKAAGQVIGAYGFATWHYSSKNNGSIDAARAVMIEQTNAWISICAGKLDGWFAIDQELESGYSMGLTPADNEILLNECTAMLEAAGFTVCIYCSASWAMARFNKDNVSADLWIAYYYADPTDPDFSNAADYQTASGQYFAYMRSCGDQLCGWQFGRIGYGAKYGVGSANLDRNLFYKSAAQGAYPTQTYSAFSASNVQIKIEFTPETFEMLSAYIGGTLGIVCDTSTLGDGYFITGYATSGDQAGIRAECARLGAQCDAYYAPISQNDIQIAMQNTSYAVLADVTEVVGGMGVVCYTALLEDYIVTGALTPSQQQVVLQCLDQDWGVEWFVYTAPEVEVAPEPEPEVAPEAEAAPETEQEPEPELDVTPEPEPKPDPDPDPDVTPDLAPEDNIPTVPPELGFDDTADPKEQVTALLVLIKKLLKKVLALLS